MLGTPVQKFAFEFPFLHANAPALYSITSIKSTFTVMGCSHGPVQAGFDCAPPEESLLTASQGLNTGTSAVSLPTASSAINASQTQGTSQLQEPYPTIIRRPTTSLDAGIGTLKVGNNTATIGPPAHHSEAKAISPIYPGINIARPADGLDVAGDSEAKVLPTMSMPSKMLASSTRTSVDTHDKGNSETAHQSAHTHSMPPFPKTSKVPSMALESSTTVDNLNLKTSSVEVVLANGASTNTPSPATDTQLGHVFGTQSITAKSKSQYIFPSSPTLSLGYTSTLGSSIPTSVPVPETSGSQTFVTLDSATSLSPHATALPDFSKSSPALTINAQTVTADSLGHYLLDSQTLTRGGMITVSGTTISLAPDASDVVVGTSTEALRPSFTAGSGSGANGNEVQKFNGDALGARDGLWGSSLMLLVSFFVLLWL